MIWGKWIGVNRIDADGYLRRVTEEDAFHVVRQAEAVVKRAESTDDPE